VHPELVIGSVQIQTYAAVRTAYVFIALAMTLRVAARQRIDTAAVVGAFAIGVPVGILGARALDAVEYADRYVSLTEVFAGGSSIYGAFIAVVPAVWLYARSVGVPTLRLLDTGGPALALGEAMTRVGCFLNGCCYGVPWNGPWAVSFPPNSFAYRDQLSRGLLTPGETHSLAVHPVQLYSAILALCAFVAILRLALRPHREGAGFFAFLVFYGALRLLMAPLRQEALLSMKLFSVAFIVAGMVGLLARRPRLAPTPRPRALSPSR
jgi:phosphatidylglycerol:prolipoprotein diacylglycerol transferase